MKLNRKKLPNGWAYLVSIRQIKDIVRQTEVDVRLVEFKGPHKPSKQGLCWGANLDARVDSGQWCYRFQFCGLPDDVLPLDRAKLAQLVLADITQFVSRQSVNPLDTTVVPEHRIMFFHFVDGKLSPSFSTKKQNSMDDMIEMADRNRWWES